MSASPPYMEKVTARGERGIGTGYGRFIAAVATSFYGDWFTTVALLVAVYQLSPGPVAPALFTLVRLAPRLVASTPGGHLADRVNPGLLTALTSAVQATATLALVAAVTAGSLPLIYVLVAVSSFLGALARPAHMPIITALVPADRRRGGGGRRRRHPPLRPAAARVDHPRDHRRVGAGRGRRPRRGRDHAVGGARRRGPRRQWRRGRAVPDMGDHRGAAPGRPRAAGQRRRVQPLRALPRLAARSRHGHRAGRPPALGPSPARRLRRRRRHPGGRRRCGQGRSRQPYLGGPSLRRREDPRRRRTDNLEEVAPRTRAVARDLLQLGQLQREEGVDD